MDTIQLGPDPSPSNLPLRSLLRLRLLEASSTQRHCVVLSGQTQLARCGREDSTAPNQPRRNQRLEGTWFCHLTDAGRSLLGPLLPWNG